MNGLSREISRPLNDSSFFRVQGGGLSAQFSNGIALSLAILTNSQQQCHPSLEAPPWLFHANHEQTALNLMCVGVCVKGGGRSRCKQMSR